MSQTCDHCYWISPESVTIAHWGCSFTFFPVEVFKNSFLSELLSYGKRVLLRFFFHEKTSPSHLSTWKSGLIAILIVCYKCHDVSLPGPQSGSRWPFCYFALFSSHTVNCREPVLLLLYIAGGDLVFTFDLCPFDLLCSRSCTMCFFAFDRR